MSFSKVSMQLLIDKALYEVRTLDDFLNTLDELINYSEPRYIQSISSQVKKKYNDQQIRSFVRNSLDRIIQHYELQ